MALEALSVNGQPIDEAAIYAPNLARDIEFCSWCIPQWLQALPA